MTNHEDYVDFDLIANTYDETRFASDKILLHLRDNLLEMIDQDITVKNILEIGCGTGRVSKIFATSNFNLTGIDVSQNMLDIANKKSNEENWNFKAVIGDARNIPFEKDYFDLVFCVNVLHLIKDWKKVIQEILRVSKNGIFANIELIQGYDGELWSKYYNKIKELSNIDNVKFKTNKETLIGGDNKQVFDYMIKNGFEFRKFRTSNIIQISKTVYKIGVKYKDFSSQRFIPESIHKKVLQYLEENNYFFEEKNDFIDIKERLRVDLYFKG